MVSLKRPSLKILIFSKEDTIFFNIIIVIILEDIVIFAADPGRLC